MTDSSSLGLGEDIKSEFFRIITTNIHDAVGISDKIGNLVFRSETYEKMFGYDPTDLVEKHPFEFIHPDDQLRICDLWSLIISQPLNFEASGTFRYLHKDGHYLSVEITGKNLLQNEFINGVLITYHDETDNLNLISKYQKIEESYSALIESTGQMVWSVNIIDFGLETFNSYMSDYYKINLNIDLKPGMTPKEMLPESRVDFWMNLYRNVLSNGSTQFQYPMSSSNRILSISLNPVIINGKVIGISAFTRDETDLMIAVSQTKDERNMYLTLIENMHDYVFTVDSTDFAYKHFNNAQASFIKEAYNVDIAVGMSATTFLPGEAIEFWNSKFSHVLDCGHDEFLLNTFSGGRTIFFKVHVLEFENKECEIMVFGEDITIEYSYKKELELSNQKLTNEFEKAIAAISKLGELRDPYTAGHQRRVQALSCAIAEKMNLSQERTRNLKLGALVHDIGKIYVPADILNKPGKLSQIEFSLIQSHAEHGYRIIKEIECDPSIALMILQHHERIDGSGYPNHLVGDDILVESKILAVADVVEAMSSHRPYRAALGINEAIRELKSLSGIKFDTEVVKYCLELIENNSFVFPEIKYF